MKGDFVQVRLQLDEGLQDPVIALLAEIGYSAFEEGEGELFAYVEEAQFDLSEIKETLDLFTGIDFQTKVIPAKNWNAEWEANYKPVFIDQFCQIVPSFHTPRENFEYTIKLDPKMSFGTGHHETTRLMVKCMQNMGFLDQTVLDMGCGTGVLAILAAKMGARKIIAQDIDPWSIENTIENLKLNNIDNVEVVQGGADAIPNQKFTIILANINRNVLLDDMEAYIKHLCPGGYLVLSGFYTRDQAKIIDTGTSLNLIAGSSEIESDWMAIKLKQQA